MILDKGNVAEQRRDTQALLHFHVVSISSLRNVDLLTQNKSASATRIIAEIITKWAEVSDIKPTSAAI